VQVYRVQVPDGSILRIEGPDGASNDQLVAAAQAHFNQLASDREAMQKIADPTSGMSGLEKFNAGMGKAFADIGRGASQLVGLGPTPNQTVENRRLDAPLMNTGAGLTGNIAGNVAAFSPLMLVPGAATVGGAGALGATMAGSAPASGTGERLKNMGIGFGLGAGGQWAGTTGATMLGERAAKNAQLAATEKAQNAVRDAALAAGRKEGLVVPPSTINPTFKNSVIESLGGKIGTQQQASVTNQKAVDTLIRRGIGLPADAPVTESSLSAMRRTEGGAYKAISDSGVKIAADPQFVQAVPKIGGEYSAAATELPNLLDNPALNNLRSAFDDMVNGKSISANAALQAVKQLRKSATSNFKAFADPEKLALARAQRQAADEMDNLIERNLAANGQASLAANYRASRVNIAKLHDAEAAFTPGGHFDARVIAKIGEKQPLTGDFKTVGDFAGNFSKAVQTGEKVGSPMVHAARPVIGSAIGAGVGGIPGAIVGAGAGIAVPWTARMGMLSRAGQSALATPSYNPGLLANLGSKGMLPSAELGGLLGRQAVPAWLAYEAQK